MAMLHTGRDVQGIFLMLMVLIPALCIVMLIAVAEFSTPVNKKLIAMHCFRVMHA